MQNQINFLETKDFEEVVKIAKMHPGLRYGVGIEVQPWTNPLVSPGAPQASDSYTIKQRISLISSAQGLKH